MNMVKSIRILIAVAAIGLLAGCSPMRHVNPRQLSIDDIISMSKQGISKDIIIEHINSTHSKFKLLPDEIVKLTKEGVDSDVIKAMIKTENLPSSKAWDYYGPYGYWYDYGYPYSYYEPYRPFFDFYYHGYYGGRRDYNDEGRNIEQRGGGEERGEQRGGGQRGGGGMQRRDR